MTLSAISGKVAALSPDDTVTDILALTAEQRQRMAEFALAGWRFVYTTHWWWIGTHPRYFDQYNISLASMLEQIRRASPKAPK